MTIETNTHTSHTNPPHTYTPRTSHTHTPTPPHKTTALTTYKHTQLPDTELLKLYFTNAVNVVKNEIRTTFQDNITILVQVKLNIEISLAQPIMAYNIVPRLFAHWL